MDDPGLDPGEHARALAGLERLNRLSRTAPALLARLAPAARRLDRPLRVADLACGSGDVTVGLVRTAVRRGLEFECTGFDLSDTAVGLARERARRAGAGARFERRDLLRDGVPPGFDAAVTSLFLHHLDAPDATRLLRACVDAGVALLVVDDLARDRLGRGLAWVASRAVTRSAVVHFDAPASVDGAWTPDEALALARDAGLDGARVATRWPRRWQLVWERAA